MPCPPAARRIARISARSLPLESEFAACVWISDSTLQQAWRAFVHGSRRQTSTFHKPRAARTQLENKRHFHKTKSFSSGPNGGQQIRRGSSVPGPLEARKRATKRKMMGLATAGGMSGSMELPVLSGRTGFDLGWGSDFGWPLEQKPIWKAPKQAPSEGASRNEALSESPLPVWLQKFQKKSRIKRSNELEAILHTGKFSRLSKQERLDWWQAKLAECKSISDLRHFLAEDGVSLAEVSLSQITFRHFISLGCSTEILLEFLSDPNLNPSSAQNTSTFLQHLDLQDAQEAQPSKKALRALDVWIMRQVSLGLISEDEMQAYVASSKRSQSGLSVVKHVYSFWKGIRKSTIVKAVDLNEATLIDLAHIMSVSNHPKAIEASLEIVLALSRLPPEVCALVERSLHTAASVESGDASRQALNQAFEALSPEKLREAATILLRAMSCGDGLEKIKHQWLMESCIEALAGRGLLSDFAKQSSEKLDWARIEQELSSCSLSSIALYLESKPRDQARAFIWKYWSPSENEGQTPVSLTASSPYEDLVRSVHASSPHLLSSLGAKLFKLLQSSSDRMYLPDIAALLFRLEARVPLPTVAAAVSELADRDPYVAMGIMVADPRLRLEDYPNLVCAVFESSEFTPSSIETFLRLLNRTDILRRNGSEVTSFRLRPETAELLRVLAEKIANSGSVSTGEARQAVWRIVDMTTRAAGTERKYAKLDTIEAMDQYTFGKHASLLTADARAAFREAKLAPALVHAALVRPKRDGQRLSERTKRRVLAYVEICGGRQEAERVYDELERV